VRIFKELWEIFHRGRETRSETLSGDCETFIFPSLIHDLEENTFCQEFPSSGPENWVSLGGQS
jgi:urocanate hydratase